MTMSSSIDRNQRTQDLCSQKLDKEKKLHFMVDLRKHHGNSRRIRSTGSAVSHKEILILVLPNSDESVLQENSKRQLSHTATKRECMEHSNHKGF